MSDLYLSACGKTLPVLTKMCRREGTLRGGQEVHYAVSSRSSPLVSCGRDMYTYRRYASACIRRLQAFAFALPGVTLLLSYPAVLVTKSPGSRSIAERCSGGTLRRDPAPAGHNRVRVRVPVRRPARSQGGQEPLGGRPPSGLTHSFPSKGRTLLLFSAQLPLVTFNIIFNSSPLID